MVIIPLFEWGDGGFAGDGAEVVLQRPCVDLEDNKTVLRKLLEYVAIEADRWCGWWHVVKKNIDVGGGGGFLHGLILVEEFDFVRFVTCRSDMDECHWET